ncbi:histidine kinase [Pseudokineococcus marinus]|uniref:sensor histidine kinase n=1 Tax=Pseudokineococcus marinus TaxID=351215 RepID=UPI0030B584FA
MTVPPAAPARRRAAASTLWWLTPPLLVLVTAVAYPLVDALDVEPPPPGPLPPLGHAVLVALQAVALLPRRTHPVAALVAVVVLDAVLLGTSGGQLGLGSLAVVVATYVVARRARGAGVGTARWVLGAAVVVTSVVGGVAYLAVGGPLLEVALLVPGRAALQYGLPVVVAERQRARERLVQLERERAEAAERERRDRAQRELQAGRTALARELHDIAGHHLSGIVVSAQAASALMRSDPERAREVLAGLQDDARTALADLRRTVGLLRSDDDGPDGGPGAPGRTPSLAAVAALVEEARARGQRVEHAETGGARPLSPLAETAAYRMVQESLANSARHAPGAACAVGVEHAPDAVRVTVTNGPAAVAPVDHGGGQGYGLAGMAERAALVGARLVTGPQPDGGWRNELVVPVTERSTPT